MQKCSEGVLKSHEGRLKKPGKNCKLENMDIVLCPSRELRALDVSGKEFALWLHFLKGDWPEFEEYLRRVAHGNCTLVYTSGPDSKDWHDRVDDVLIDIEREDVLTAWGEGGISECIEEFSDITRSYCKKVVLVVVDDDSSIEDQLRNQILPELRSQYD